MAKYAKLRGQIRNYLEIRQEFGNKTRMNKNVKQENRCNPNTLINIVNTYKLSTLNWSFGARVREVRELASQAADQG